MPRTLWGTAALLVLAAVLGAGALAAIQAFVPGAGGNRARTEAVVHDYLLEHPEILPEAMDRLHARETGAVVDANRAAIFDPFGSAWAGNPKGDVTIAAYMDYACVYCRASLAELRQLLGADHDVRIVYRELPILSPASRTAAQWSLAAAEQGKFRPFHDALFAADRLDQAAIDKAASVAGLDRAKAEAAVQSSRVNQQIDHNLELAGKLGMTGTPSWVIGDRVLSGALPYAQLLDAVKQQRKAE